MALRMNSDFQIKQRYFIEPGFGLSGWILRKEGTNVIVKKAKHRMFLMYFAETMLTNRKAELRVCDSNGMLEEIIDFERLSNIK